MLTNGLIILTDPYATILYTTYTIHYLFSIHSLYIVHYAYHISCTIYHTLLPSYTILHTPYTTIQYTIPLGLTGWRLGPADLTYSGIATHFIARYCAYTYAHAHMPMIRTHTHVQKQ
ncbi:hypothetical protein EON63_05730 [archaeon]|nr:MAG: hypothetical protein EON63_05730 [archaeon]